MSELRFDGRSVIVTGAGRGFGRCHALLLASRGAKVVVADYGVNLDGSGSSSEPAEQVVKEIEAAGGEAVACCASVADEAGAASIVQTALDAFGRLDVVVNNAGIVDPHWFEDLGLDQFRTMVDVHYFGTVYVTMAAWPHLVAAGNGCIVNTTSEAILGVSPKGTSYSGAKGGVFGLTRSLALDGTRHGVRVNAIAPRGNTRMSTTGMLAYVFEQPEEAFKSEFFNSMKPELTSPVVAYLAHESCPLNGEVLVVGAGQVMQMAVIETKGYSNPDLTAEDVAANIGTILDRTDADLMSVSNPLS